MVIHGHQLRWGGRSQRRSASLQVCSLNGTSTTFKRKSAFESSEIRQRATVFAREGVRGRNRAGRRPFDGGLQGTGKWRREIRRQRCSSRLRLVQRGQPPWSVQRRIAKRNDCSNITLPPRQLYLFPKAKGNPNREQSRWKQQPIETSAVPTEVGGTAEPQKIRKGERTCEQNHSGDGEAADGVRKPAFRETGTGPDNQRSGADRPRPTISPRLSESES